MKKKNLIKYIQTKSPVHKFHLKLYFDSTVAQ